MTTEDENNFAEVFKDFCRQRVQSHRQKVDKSIAEMQRESTEKHEIYQDILLFLHATEGSLDGMNQAWTYLAALDSGYQSVIAEGLKGKLRQAKFAKLSLALMTAVNNHDWEECRHLINSLEEFDKA